MISQVSEKKMHLVRWLLAIGWLTIIASLLYDPITPHLTDPNNTWSPFHTNLEVFNNPETSPLCVKVQDVCVPHQADPYGMGPRIFWAMVLPIGIMILLLLGHETWRRICPLYFFSQIPRWFGIQRKRKVTNPETGSTRLELAGVDKESWLGRNYLYLQWGLFYVGLNIRILFANGTPLAMTVFLLFTIGASIVIGYLYKGRSWCQYFCPMAPIQMFYTGTRGLLGSYAHTRPPQSITQSTCRTVDSNNNEKSACVSCQSPCIDIDAERSYWEGIERPDQKMVFYSYFGLMYGFYFYYLVYSGSWAYYFSGAWTHEPGQLSTVFAPGVYIFGQAIPWIPKIIASPITIGLMALLSYGVCQLGENLYRAYLKRTNKVVSNAEILHRCFSVCVFISFNVFFLFGGRPNLRLVPEQYLVFINLFIVFVSSLWLYQSLTRSQELYNRESLASSLRRQLNKLAVDWRKFLEGRSLDDLKADEVYVLAKVIPSFKRDDRLVVYKGVLQETLEQGNVKSAESLEVLKDMRKQLNILDEEHFAVLSELGVEDPSLLDPQHQLSRENKLRIEGYRQAFELLILDLVDSGVPLQEAFDRKQKQIMALRQEYAISTAEQENVMAELFNQDGAILRQAEVLLNQLQELATAYQALRNSVPNSDAPVYVLLRQTLHDKQTLITKQLLSVLEILGDSPRAKDIANSVSIVGINVIGDVLEASDESTRWEDRLDPRIIALLKHSINSQTMIGQETRVGMTQVGQMPSPRPEVSVEVLTKLTQDLNPLTQAASLYALHQLNPTQGFQKATQLLSLKQVDPLLLETAQSILGHNQGQPGKGKTIPTFIAQIKGANKAEQRVFQQSSVRVGRSQDNDIVLLDSRISRQHAIFYLDETGMSVKDLGSSYGIRIGNQHVQDDRKPLKSGDIVRFSSAEDDLFITVQFELKQIQGDTLILNDLSTLEKLLWLHQSNLFKGLNANTLVDLASRSQTRLYENSEEICRRGSTADQFLVLIDGGASVQSGQRSGQVLTPGQTIGELDVLTHSPYSETIVSDSARTRTLGIEAQVFELALRQNSMLARNLLETVSSRLLATMK